MKKNMDRRKFVTAAGLAGAAGVLSACKGNTQSQDCADAGPEETEFNWKMVTTWPRDFPGLGTGAARIASNIERISGGRIKVRVFGGNELVPPFETFDAVSRGTAEMGHSASYYWKGKVPAAQVFTGIPFGMTATEMNGWLYHGGGMELWREAYEPFGVVPFAAGNSGTQMGGWFNKEINSLDDLQGLKMRIPGIGGEVLRRAGGTPTNIPGAELFTALQTGTIDATEWLGPSNDLAFGLFRAASYYYYPGWQEPGSTLECIVNREAYDSLPDDLQAAVEVACQASTTDMLSELFARSAEALDVLVEQHGVELRRFPDAVLDKLAAITTEVMDDEAQNDALFARVYESYQKYFSAARKLSNINEREIYNRRPE